MVDITNIDHVTEGLDKLPSQWKDKANVRGLLQAWLEPMQDAETNLIGMRDGFNINTAIGSQLDIIGGHFGKLRKGRNDEEYRNLLITNIASSSGSGTPNDIIDLFGAIAGTSNIKYWEHYPLGFALSATGGSIISPTAVDELQSATAAGVGLVTLLYDPYNYAWIGGENAKGDANLIALPDEEFIIDDLGNQIVVTAEYEIVGDGDYRSSFVDNSLDALTLGSLSGYGTAYGERYGGSLQGYSQFADASTIGNALVTSGGFGYVPWAGGDNGVLPLGDGVGEYDPVTGTTNKAEPPYQIKKSGLKYREPLARQYFNWMMANIDSWFQRFANRAAVGTIKMTTDNTKTIGDYGSQFLKSDGTDSTWTYVGTMNVTTTTVPVYIFKRTA